MSVTVRPYRRGGWEVDITFRLPNGSRHRERNKAPATSKSAAQRWGELLTTSTSTSGSALARGASALSARRCIVQRGRREAPCGTDRQACSALDGRGTPA